MNEESYICWRFEDSSEYSAISFYSLCQEALHVVLANGSSAGHDDAQGRRQLLRHLGAVDHEERYSEREGMIEDIETDLD